MTGKGADNKLAFTSGFVIETAKDSQAIFDKLEAVYDTVSTKELEMV